MENIGVLGAGTIGVGVAQDFAQVGYSVILVDISDQILEKAKKEIHKNIRLQSLFTKEVDSEQAEVVLSRINFTTDYHSLAVSEFIIENVPEKWETKRAVYKRIEEICPPNCIFLVNTSCLSITKIASVTRRPGQVIGTHFMNPVPMKKMVEVIRGDYTTDETIEVTNKLLLSIGKQSIIVNDYPGFVSNRISHLFMNEAAFVVQDQVASPQDVDDIFKECFGHKMGPLETADLIGLDTVVDSLKVLYESYQDSKYRCCPLLRKMVDAGHCGRKSGQGFYSY